MAWIESHQSLGRHPKMLRLAARVRACGPQVIGHLHYLWWWALDYAPNGDLSRFAAQEVAAASEWNGDPDLWLAALKQCGWIDETGNLHDWHDYAGKLVAERAKASERMRSFREHQRTGAQRSANVRRTFPERAELPNPTQPNPTREVECDSAREGKGDPGSDIDPPKGFPRTEAEAASAAAATGAPEEFSRKLWLLASSRGWRDAKGIPLRSWASYVSVSLAYQRDGDERRARANGRAKPESRQTSEEIHAPLL